ncbi:hypothetical protein [Ramlibacter sp. 2FC]|uniref:hypothetical protein n=1 Tax=Ramlibacter sp. 2FC TaxID=2502188 RepID=UPI0010F78636|nr:hypothetical protein [Ramlibacter sp. 2FC]
MNKACWILVLLLAACAGGPPPPDWHMSAHAALERAVAAYLEGNNRVAEREFERGRAELARTGRIDLVARAELMRCAARVASLVLEPCTGFEALRVDAGPDERAYADYLAGRALTAQELARLPAPQRAVAAGGAALPQAEPLARLVAAGVLLQAGRASPEVRGQAVETASTQGWRRPLLAWLGVQLRLAEQGGDAAEAERLRRRMALVQGQR